MTQQSLLQKITKFIRKQVSMLLEPIIGYSRAVSFAKIVLLSAAFLLTAILIIFPLISPVNKNFRLTFSSIENGKKGESPKMVNPHLQGVYGKNQTYNVTADSAIQDTKDIMTLINIRADINLENDGWLSATADSGMINHAKSSMDLKGNINIHNQDGYEFYTEEVYIDMKQDSIYGNKAINGQGPAGNISADNFYIEKKGNRILLTGNVKVVITSIGANNKSGSIQNN